jgi:hypothetical protein
LRLHPRDAIADSDDARHRDGGAGLVTANSSGCATLVAMVQAGVKKSMIASLTWLQAEQLERPA